MTIRIVVADDQPLLRTGFKALIATGLSNEEIAGRLYVSQSTVKTHANRAMMKVGARDRAQLVVFAYQAGLARA